MKEKMIFWFLFAIVHSLNNGLQKVNVCDMAVKYNKFICLGCHVFIYYYTFDVYYVGL